MTAARRVSRIQPPEAKPAPAPAAALCGAPHIELRLPLRTVNALNRREHWAQRAKRAKAERRLAWGSVLEWFQSRAMVTPDTQFVRNVWVGRIGDPLVVTLTREGVRLMDGDGLQASFKAIRDGVADALGVNDNDPRVTWRYEQRKAKQYGVVIRIEPRLVHNHGTEEGPGLGCRELLVDGRLVGECVGGKA